MPKGPQGQKRIADVISNAIDVTRIVTGQVEETGHDSGTEAATERFRVGVEAQLKKWKAAKNRGPSDLPTRHPR